MQCLRIDTHLDISQDMLWSIGNELSKGIRTGRVPFMWETIDEEEFNWKLNDARDTIDDLEDTISDLRSDIYDLKDEVKESDNQLNEKDSTIKYLKSLLDNNNISYDN